MLRRLWQSSRFYSGAASHQPGFLTIETLEKLKGVLGGSGAPKQRVIPAQLQALFPRLEDQRELPDLSRIRSLKELRTRLLLLMP